MSHLHIAAKNWAAMARSAFGIRGRLMLLAILIISPLVLDRVRLLEVDRVSRINGAVQKTLALARQGLQAHAEMIAATRATLKLARRVLAPVELKGAGCEAALASVNADIPWVKGLTLADENGRVTCSTNPNSAGLDVSDRLYIQKALQSGEFVLSDYIIGRQQRTPAMAGAQRIETASGTGVLLVTMDLHWIGHLAGSTAPLPTVLLLDSRGTVLVGYPKADSTIARFLADENLVSQVLERGEGAVHAKGSDGAARVFGFARIPDTDVHLVVGIDESEVLSSVNRETRIAYLHLAIILAVVFGAWMIGVHLIMEPIGSLMRMAARYGSGNLNARAGDGALTHEFAPLADALEKMARKLSARENDLLESNQLLERLATTDALTGIANRRSFDRRLADEWSRAAAQGEILALLMIDIDYFKLFNDQNGHVDGDACLQAVAGVLARHAGRGLAARYGGEEFAVLMPDADDRQARDVAGSIRAAVEDLRIQHPGAPTGRVTVSVGVACCAPHSGQDPSGFVAMADDALYAAKRRGRNTVMAHHGGALAAAS